jgi:hypothetical protein
MTADELALHLRCSRDAAVKWARDRALGLKGPGATTLYELAEVNAALRRDRDVTRGEAPRPPRRRRDEEPRVRID